MIDLKEFYPLFEEIDKKYPMVEKLCGGPVAIAECDNGIVLQCTDSSDGYCIDFINDDDCFSIARYFDDLGNLLYRINRGGK